MKKFKQYTGKIEIELYKDDKLTETFESIKALTDWLEVNNGLTKENRLVRMAISNYSIGTLKTKPVELQDYDIKRSKTYNEYDVEDIRAFKDYEYGWYGFHSSYQNNFMHIGYCHKDGKDRYTDSRKGTFKQLPKLKGVMFIYGDYKTSV